MATYGKVAWDDNSQNKSKFNREKFLNLEEGMTTVRVLMDSPYKYLYHKVKFANDTANNFGRNVRCSIDNCPLCEKQEFPQKPKYVVPVVVKKTGQFKYLEFGAGLYNGINTLRKNIPGCENVMEYDLNIIKNPKAGATGYYTAVPGVKSPLTADEVEKMEQIDYEWLDDYVKPISSEEVNNTIERISKWLDKNKANAAALGNDAAQHQQAARGGKKAQMQVVENHDDEKPIGDDAFNFKVMKK